MIRDARNAPAGRETFGERFLFKLRSHNIWRPLDAQPAGAFLEAKRQETQF